MLFIVFMPLFCKCHFQICLNRAGFEKNFFFPKKSEKNGTEANIKIGYNSPNSQLFSQIISNRFPKGINVRQLKATLSNEFPFL